MCFAAITEKTTVNLVVVTTKFTYNLAVWMEYGYNINSYFLTILSALQCQNLLDRGNATGLETIPIIAL